MSKERPILFSAPMVKALLEGRKPMCETGDIQREMDKRLQEGVTK